MAFSLINDYLLVSADADHPQLVTNAGPKRAYYKGANNVSVSDNDGSLAGGESLTATTRTWFFSAEATISVGGATAAQIVAPRSSAVFPVDSYGAKADGTTADDAAIAAALLDAVDAGGGVLNFGEGTYRITNLATLDIGQSPISIQGSGKGVTTLYFDVATDLSGYCVTFDPTTAAFDSRRISDLTIQGPGSYSRASGNAPNLLVGILWSSRLIVENVWVKRCKYGLETWGDHQIARDVKCSDGWAGLLAPSFSSMPTGGDHVMENCDLTENALCSIYVADGGRIEGSTFIHTHLGAAPYAIYLVGTDLTPALANCYFEGCHWEFCGNGGIYGIQRGLYTTRFVDFIAAKSATYTKSGGNAGGWIDVGATQNVLIDAPDAFNDAWDAAVIQAFNLESVVWRRANKFIREKLAGLGKPTFKATGAIGRRSLVEWDAGLARPLTINASSASVAKGDVVHFTTTITAANLGTPNYYGECIIVASGVGRPCGIAMAAGAASSQILVQHDGPVNAVASGAITRGDQLMADGAKVKTSDGTGAIIGVALDGAADTAAVPVMVRL